MKKSREERRNGNKGRERMRSSTGGGETATEIEIATGAIGTSVAGEWMTTRDMIRAVIGKHFYVVATIFEKSYSKPFSL